MTCQGVIGGTHQSYFLSLINVLSYFSKHSRGDRNQHHQYPHADDGPLHKRPGNHGSYFSGQYHDNHPVHTHQRDQEDGGIHVGVAQVEDTFAHDVAKHPRLLGEVHNEEDGEGH